MDHSKEMFLGSRGPVSGSPGVQQMSLPRTSGWGTLTLSFWSPPAFLKHAGASMKLPGRDMWVDSGYSRTLDKWGEGFDSRCFQQGSTVFLWSLSVSGENLFRKLLLALRIDKNFRTGGLMVHYWKKLKQQINSQFHEMWHRFPTPFLCTKGGGIVSSHSGGASNAPFSNFVPVFCAYIVFIPLSG